jgi:drug/metabolite transporter (DMT)-like permease
MPFYLHYFPVATIVPGAVDFLWLLVFATGCTVLLQILQIEALRSISAFTLTLGYNLEPVYSIILAMLFLGEAKELNFSFYAGLGLIFLSVLLQTRKALRPAP